MENSRSELLYGSTDPLSMFILLLKMTADIFASRLGVVFRWLLRLGDFLACWRLANVAQIPKGPPSCSVATYRPISIKSILSNVFGADSS